MWVPSMWVEQTLDQRSGNDKYNNNVSSPHDGHLHQIDIFCYFLSDCCYSWYESKLNSHVVKKIKNYHSFLNIIYYVISLNTIWVIFQYDSMENWSKLVVRCVPLNVYNSCPNQNMHQEIFSSVQRKRNEKIGLFIYGMHDFWTSNI